MEILQNWFEPMNADAETGEAVHEEGGFPFLQQDESYQASQSKQLEHSRDEVEKSWKCM